ncbi:hypothetical protein [Jiella mangrovi]|uniref:hypothetical protein n=1 Tax=Jiella mangrovi TaxID=2821407 RepID=UPI001AE8A3FF|nr:hypothetical protein [Jiella mangrovi]
MTRQAVVDGGHHAVGSSPAASAGPMGPLLPVAFSLGRKAGRVGVGARRSEGALYRVDDTLRTCAHRPQ